MLLLMIMTTNKKNQCRAKDMRISFKNRRHIQLRVGTRFQKQIETQKRHLLDDFILEIDQKIG